MAWADLQSFAMSVPLAGLILTALALALSLGFNCLQYKWRKQEREEHDRERAEARDEQLQKERKPPEFYNLGGNPSPIRITGSHHLASGPRVDVSGLVTVVNPTPLHVKITPQRLVVNGVEWGFIRLAFHLRKNPQERYDRISLMGNTKEDYELHFVFPEDRWPKGLSGELHLTSSNRPDEPFSIPVSFA